MEAWVRARLEATKDQLHSKHRDVFRYNRAQRRRARQFPPHSPEPSDDELEDCFSSVFHVSDSYALLSGEALPGAHTATNAALRAYLIRRLTGNDTGLDFDVKIDQASEFARSCS